jgi:integrase/recombinase XerD
MTLLRTNAEWLLEGFQYELEIKCRPKTVEYYCGFISRFLRWARSVGIDEDIRFIDKHHILSFFHYLLQEKVTATGGNGSRRQVHRKDKTLWPYHVSLKRFFSWMVIEGYIEHNPMDEIRMARPNPAPIEPYRPEHIERMMKVLDFAWQNARTHRQKMIAARNRAVLSLFLESGLRCGEMVNLKLVDVDLTRQRLSVRDTKNKKGRIVGFGQQSKKALWQYLSLRALLYNGEAVWVTEECKPMALEGIRQIIRRLKQDSGLEHLKGSVHKLRHTFGTTYYKHTRDMKGTRLLLGHSTLAMTERYTQFIEAEDALIAYDRQGPLDWIME